MSPTWVQIAMLGVGATLLCCQTYRMVLAIRSKRWPQTEGEVLEVRIEEGDFIRVGVGHDRSDDDDWVKPVVRYTYSVGGREYRGSRISFGPKELLGYAAGSETIEGLNRGSKVHVYYDPKRPRRSVLKTGANAANWSLAFGYLIFTLILVNAVF